MSQSSMHLRLGHAIVIGASMAGLTTARVLADHFEQVTIVERDQLPPEIEARKGVPQGRHGHVVLMRGQQVLHELFPGLTAELEAAGCVYATTNDARWYDAGIWRQPPRKVFGGYGATRPLLEATVRGQVEALPQVRFLTGQEVKRLIVSEDRRRISGISYSHIYGDRREEELAADLVVDASGRGSRSHRWLGEMGFGHAAETSVACDIGYATRIYRQRGEPAEWRTLLIYPKAPRESRGGIILTVENGLWMVSLSGRFHDFPPDDEAGFLEYARNLAHPALYEAIRDAEPVTPPVSYKYKANRWWRFERLLRFPDGLVIVGDAVCSFNPVYGQGMSVAAMEAELLGTALAKRRGQEQPLAGLSRAFQREAARMIQAPWRMATSADLRYPETGGRRALSLPFVHWYSDGVTTLTGSDPFATELFYEVLNLMKPPSALFHPRIFFGVLRQSLGGGRKKAAPVLASLVQESLHAGH